jgi:magnesium transporter
MPPVHSEERLQEAFTDVARLLEKHRVLETLARRQEGPRRDVIEHLQHRQNLVELDKRLRLMHAADVAYVLEALPRARTLTVGHLFLGAAPKVDSLVPS